MQQQAIQPGDANTIGALMITDTILWVPDYDYSRMAPKPYSNY